MIAYNVMVEKEIFDARAAEYEPWYQTPQGHYTDASEKELFLRLIQPESGQSVLDVGCGTGHNLAFFTELGLKAVGIDASKPMLDIASRKLGNNVKLYRGHAEELPFDDNSFDIVTLITVLEFVSEPVKVLKEAARVAREQIYLGILNKASLLAINRRLKGRFRDSIYSQARFYSICEIKQMAERAMGKMPLHWRSVLFFPLRWHRCTHWLDRLLLLTNNPFGAFLGVKLDLQEIDK